MTGIQGVNYGYQATPKFCGNGEKKSSSPILKGTLIGAGTGAVVGGGVGVYLNSIIKGALKEGGEYAVQAVEQVAGCSVKSAMFKNILKNATYVAVPCAVVGLVIGAIVKACSGNKNKA